MFPGIQALKLTKNRVNTINPTNPLFLLKNITLTVLDCSATVPLHSVVHYSSWVISASTVSPNLTRIGSTVHLVRRLYEEC